MINAITVGMRILLPSGNIVRVVRREGAEWLCEYTELARARGQVVFAGRFLREHGVRA